MTDASDPIDLLRARNPLPPGSLSEAAAEQAARVLARLRVDDGPDPGPEAADRASAGLARRLRGHKRLVLSAVAGGLVLLAGAAVATATGVMPWITRAQEFRSTPFVTAPNPAALPGSNVVLTVPGPESTTFEVITNDTVTIGGKVNSCVAVINKDPQGRARGAGLKGCGGAGAAVAEAGSFDWQAPSGTRYAVVEGPQPTSDTATVALRDPNGATLATGRVEGGYFLIYTLATAALPSDGSLVFSDASGHVVDAQPLDLSPLRPCTSAASPAPCG
jgi:hypothetical protein